jgi:hypothetical protein
VRPPRSAAAAAAAASSLAAKSRSVMPVRRSSEIDA